MLQNDYLVAKIDVDPAENEPFKGTMRVADEVTMWAATATSIRPHQRWDAKVISVCCALPTEGAQVCATTSQLASAER